MLDYQDEQRVREIVREETADILSTVNRTADNVDKILKIVTSSNQELTITKARVDKHDKRLRKVESKLKIKSPSASAVFA